MTLFVAGMVDLVLLMFFTMRFVLSKANTMIRYLGEEGKGGKLPGCVAGAISISNPMKHEPKHDHTIWTKMLSPKTGKTSIPILNKLTPDHWSGAECDIHIPHVSVPVMMVSASDDEGIRQKNYDNLHRCLANPNVIFVKTRSGGHMGFHTSRWNNPFANISYHSGMESWADRVTSSFIRSILKMRNPNGTRRNGLHEENVRKLDLPSVVAPKVSEQKLTSRL